MPSAHARLGPSDAARWINCPASIGMDDARPVGPEREDTYAEEGTCAHVLAEIKASHHFGFTTDREYELRRARWVHDWARYTDNPATVAEMDTHTDSYVILLERIRRDMGPGTVVALEQRLETGIPGCWGTSDTVLSNPTKVHIVDFKYGAGVPVAVEGNEQLKLYALGALRAMDLVGTVEDVEWTVHQPRINNYAATAGCSADDLRAWRDSIMPIAADALAGSTVFGPSEKACRWCRHSGSCTAQAADIFDDGWLDKDPAFLSPEEISRYLDLRPRISQWLSAFEEAALTAAYERGVAIPGWKVVRSGGQRKWLDPDAAVERLCALGYSEDEVTNTKIKGLGDLEALLGKARFATEMEPYLHKPPGRESLAREDDDRPAINPNTEAAKAFTEETQ